MNQISRDFRFPVWLAALAAALVLMPALGSAQAPQDRIDEALARAAETGIPLSLLESKLAEGTAKGVPLERIAMAVENRFEALTRAREVMARGAPDLDAAQISVGADALGAGVDEAVLEEIAATTPQERRTVAVAALTHLVGEGIVPEQALIQVQEALARGAGGLAGIPGFAGPPADLPVPEAVGPPQGGPGDARVGPPGKGPPGVGPGTPPGGAG